MSGTLSSGTDGRYATQAEVRAHDRLHDTVLFPAASVSEAIEWAETLIDRFTGTTWTWEPFTASGEPTGRCYRLTDDEMRPVLFVRSVTAATTQDGTPVDVTGWRPTPTGLVHVPSAGTVPVVVNGTAGASQEPPPDIAWCARTLARQYLLDLVSRVPDRALSGSNEFGQFVAMAQAGGVDRPTSLPEVNARLAARRHRPIETIF